MSSFLKAIVLCAAAAVIVMAAASTADAQGKGNAWGRGRSGSPSAASAPAPSGGTTEGAADFFVPAGAGFRNFGAWLDDASVLAPGAGWATASFGYWRTPLAREIDVPM